MKILPLPFSFLQYEKADECPIEVRRLKKSAVLCIFSMLEGRTDRDVHNHVVQRLDFSNAPVLQYEPSGHSWQASGAPSPLSLPKRPAGQERGALLPSKQ